MIKYESEQFKHVFKPAACSFFYYSAISFDRAITRTNKSFIRAIVEQVNLVAIILHGRVTKAANNTIFEIDFKPAAEVIKRYINRPNTCSNADKRVI